MRGFRTWSPGAAAARGSSKLAPAHRWRARAGSVERQTNGRLLWQALRPHQWAKNLLLFVPLVLTPAQVTDPAKWVALLAAFACWSAVASAGYLANDALDLAADRADPVKRGRP